MNLQLKNSKGKIEISKDIIITIANKAAVECYGLAGISTEGITDLIKKENSKGVRVEIVDGDKLILEVGIIVMYGTKISEVAQNVMETVRYTVEDITGAKVEKVNIRVQGVKIVE